MKWASENESRPLVAGTDVGRNDVEGAGADSSSRAERDSAVSGSHAADRRVRSPHVCIVALVATALSAVLSVVPSFTGFAASNVTRAANFEGGHIATGALTFSYPTAISAADRTASETARFFWNNTATPVCICTQVYDSSWNIGLEPLYDNHVAWDGATYILPSANHAPYSFAYQHLNDYWTNGYVTNERISVAAHELGHALGLAHRSGPYLMNPLTSGSTGRYTHYGIHTPQQDEINGVNQLY